MGRPCYWTICAKQNFHFAASDNGYEMICLIWFDGTEEPELWVYDCNGESRYKDLAAYLQAYIDDDVSASEVKWKLADM